MLKRNLPFILIALITALLIAIVIWVFDLKIKNIEKKSYHSALMKQAKQKLH